jgi:hypothetical protein
MYEDKKINELIRKIYALKFEVGLNEPHELECIDTPFVRWVRKCLVQLTDLIEEAPLSVSPDDPF